MASIIVLQERVCRAGLVIASPAKFHSRDLIIPDVKRNGGSSRRTVVFVF
jgi:hypothetical protein